MKYTICPNCNRKIIDRYPPKCVYCGYDGTPNVEGERLELLDPPMPPIKNEAHTIRQAITILISLAGIIGFLITYLNEEQTVIRNTLESTSSNMTLLRFILFIVAISAFILFISTNRSYNVNQMKYMDDMMRIAEINRRIQAGATLEDFSEEEVAIILNAREAKNAQQINNQYNNTYK